MKLLNEQNNRRFREAKTKKNYPHKLICDICGKETGEDEWIVKCLDILMKASIAKDPIEVDIVFCKNCKKKFKLMNPIVSFINSVLLDLYSPDLRSIIEASIRKKKGG